MRPQGPHRHSAGDRRTQRIVQSWSSRFFGRVQCRPQSRPSSSDWNSRARTGNGKAGSSRTTDMKVPARSPECFQPAPTSGPSSSPR